MGAYQFFNYMAGCIATLTVGYFSSKLGTGYSAASLGKIIALAVSVGYGGSMFCWWRVSNLLKKKHDKNAKLASSD